MGIVHGQSVFPSQQTWGVGADATHGSHRWVRHETAQATLRLHHIAERLLRTVTTRNHSYIILSTYAGISKLEEEMRIEKVREQLETVYRGKLRRGCWTVE